MTRHPRVAKVEVLDTYRLLLHFTDGASGKVDLDDWIRSGEGLIAELRDEALFRRAAVDPEAGTVCWPNGVDLDPDVLHAEVTGTSLAPSVRTQS